MDTLTLFGIIVAIAAIFGGQYLDGGQLSVLLNLPAFIIVVGGSFGAVMLQTPRKVFHHTMTMIPWLLNPPLISFSETTKTIVGWSVKVRKKGLIILDDEIEHVDPFTQKALQMLLSGIEPLQIREVMEDELDSQQMRDSLAIKVFESLGGYCPTIGIVGAVLGLIHVMGNLTDPSQLGAGIAVAFVATIYGVGLANLLFIPIANKLKTHVHRRLRKHEMMLTGIIAIAHGEHPRLIRHRLNAYDISDAAAEAK